MAAASHALAAVSAREFLPGEQHNHGADDRQQYSRRVKRRAGGGLENSRAMKPPTNEPTMPSTPVMISPICSAPGHDETRDGTNDDADDEHPKIVQHGPSPRSGTAGPIPGSCYPSLANSSVLGQPLCISASSALKCGSGRNGCSSGPNFLGIALTVGALEPLEGAIRIAAAGIDDGDLVGCPVRHPVGGERPGRVPGRPPRGARGDRARAACRAGRRQ